ncbi:unnamed protein product [Medioppia subpectinata]|uniref:Uncharacterized protein n=1 Tax=Medioppia subpectinata TaxID=1979941 RepID=A0A7R9KP98_9ACAR|nr:unnamed protein product [Medioppia subpectinata]CAG2107299.1 unnamed protein product [Medioppia subpectinata]
MTQQMKHLKTTLETTDDGENDDQKRQQPNIYAKNSMDRFGDDLCALLVSYLSFEDRFLYECVSKQFQRTVFESVVDITLSDRFIQRLLKEKRSDIQMLATIAIKCANIECIDCRGISAEYEEHIPEVLNTFRDNCRHLREIYLTSKSAQTMPSLGPLVTRIGGINCYTDSEALTHCHRLSHLRTQSFHALNTLFGHNLHTFELRSHLGSLNDRWSAFVAHNQSLKCLVFWRFYFGNTISLTEMCGQLSRLTQLRELTLGLDFDELDGQKSAAVNQCLRTIGVNCKQLKRLSLQLISVDTEPVFPISLDSLRVYRQLKRLHLTAYATVDDLLLDPLRHCKRLTDLVLCLCQSVPPESGRKCLSLYAESLAQICGHLSQLPLLRELTLGLVFGSPDGLNCSVINHSLRSIGVNCKQLYRLSLELMIFDAIDPTLETSLDSLRCYSRLRRLRLAIDVAIDDRLLDPLRHCKRLTHLELCLRKMTANVLKYMHINCPRLQYLFIRDFYSIIDTECLSHISRLPALQMLVIDGKNCCDDSEDSEGCGEESNDLSDNELNAVLSSSPKLKTIEIRVNNEKKFYSK